MAIIGSEALSRVFKSSLRTFFAQPTKVLESSSKLLVSNFSSTQIPAVRMEEVQYFRPVKGFKYDIDGGDIQDDFVFEYGAGDKVSGLLLAKILISDYVLRGRRQRVLFCEEKLRIARLKENQNLGSERDDIEDFESRLQLNLEDYWWELRTIHL